MPAWLGYRRTRISAVVLGGAIASSSVTQDLPLKLINLFSLPLHSPAPASEGKSLLLAFLGLRGRAVYC